MRVGEALILCYHNVVPDGTPAAMREALLAVTRTALLNQVRYLLSRYQPVGFDEVERGTPSRRPALILTFDDGYRAVRDHVLPLLAPLRIPPYVFINPAFVGGWNTRDKLMALALYGSARAVSAVEELLGVRIGTGETFERARRFVEARTAMWQALGPRGRGAIADVDELFACHADKRLLGHLESSALCSWDDLAALQAAGFRIGNHTQRHLDLTALPREVVREEIADARRALADRLGRDEPVVCYPRGKSNALVREEAAAAGYRWGLGTVPGRISGGRPTLRAPRVVVSPQDSVAGLIWRASRLRAWARGLRGAAARGRFHQTRVAMLKGEVGR